MAVLAHEMRTPLAAVSSAAYILEQSKPDNLTARQVGTIQRQTRHLTRLAEDLVDIARISRVKIELRWERVDLSDTARNAVQTVQPFIDARGQELILTLPPGPVQVNGDPVRLNQILVNLLSNAAKYTGAGGTIRLEVETRAEGGGGGMSCVPGEAPVALLRVRDTGIGIAPHALPTLFDLFSQVDSSEAKSHAGLSAGLHLVKRLTEIHGGMVTARSAGECRGSEFVVWLTLDETDLLETNPGETNAAEPSPQEAG